MILLISFGMSALALVFGRHLSELFLHLLRKCFPRNIATKTKEKEEEKAEATQHSLHDAKQTEDVVAAAALPAPENQIGILFLFLSPPASISTPIIRVCMLS